MSEESVKSGWPKKVLAVSSGGGHWIELMRLVPAFDGCEVTYVTVEPSYRSQVDGERFRVVLDATRWNKFKLALMLMQMIWVLVSERPDVVISTGAAPGYFAVRFGKLLGARTIWVDSMANIDELSSSGQQIGKHADLWLTQWEHLAMPDGPMYRGGVL